MDEAMKVGDPPSTEDIEPQQPQQRLSEPNTGSYENFMATFGRAIR